MIQLLFHLAAAVVLAVVFYNLGHARALHSLADRIDAAVDARLALAKAEVASRLPADLDAAKAVMADKLGIDVAGPQPAANTAADVNPVVGTTAV